MLLLFAILTLGGFFRFLNLNWDQGFHLHPDERFLTMVGGAMRIPTNFLEYLNPQTSTFNPANAGYQFFVYGTFPLTLNKLLAVALQNDTYHKFTLQGRILSALVDLLVVILIFKTVLLLEKHYNLNHSIKYLASFLYAISVLPIQLSHFFAVDTFLNLFMFASFYFTLRFWYQQTFRNLALSGLFLGFAVASKVTALFILPLNVFLLIRSIRTDKKSAALFLASYFFILYTVTRLTDPYLFESGNFLNPSISQRFLENVKALQSWAGENVWYPPAVQWIHKPPIIFSLTSLAVFGLGLPSFIFSMFGVFSFVKRFLRTTLVILPLWVVLFFLFQSLQFAQTMRYFIFLYPFLAIFGAFGFHVLLRNRARTLLALAISTLLIWPLAFSSIYRREHSRVKASKWIFKNLESKSLILGEHWDDPLPLPMANTYGKRFTVEQLPVFDPDTKDKWEKMGALLQRGDYLVLSSNRGWGSIPTVPQKYPLMSKFYKNLFEGKLQYKKIKEFTSYPVIPDDWADESFTVYDHPKVLIFKNKK